MKLKIFNKGLIIIFALLANSIQAQERSVEKPHELTDSMQNLQGKMSAMKFRLNTFQLEKSLENMNLAFKGLDKKLEEGLKDFNKTFEDIGEEFRRSEPNFQLQTDGEEKNGIERVRNYSKSYSISTSDKLQIDNQYGKVSVNTWNKNEFKVDVEIKAAAKDVETAQKLIDGIEITDSKTGGTVSFKTNRKNNDHSKWGNGVRGNVRKLEINYTIYMPSKNSLDVTNRYGSTIIPDFDGKLNINTSYGSFVAKRLSNLENEIQVRYGSADITELNSSELKIAYGSLSLEVADKLSADISYGSAKIGVLKTAGNINLRYSGGFKINSLDHDFKTLNIDAAYSSVAIDLDENPNFNFDVSVNYASFGYPNEKATITGKTPADEERGFNPSKNYKGYFGKANADAKVVINSKYGGVKFN